MMTRDRVDELMKIYQETSARCEYLRSQAKILEDALKKNENCMVSDRVSMSQAITGMPHGTTVGDPVGNLALDLAMGKVTVFVTQIREELAQVYQELNAKQNIITYVDSWLKSLNDREKMVVQQKAIFQSSWGDVVTRMKETYGDACSKHTAQRIYDRAMEKIYNTAQ